MTIARVLRQLSDLHDKAKLGTLAANERAAYEAMRDDFARSMVAAQHLTLRPGETYRGALRIAHAVKIELVLPSGPVVSATLNISAGGFAALVPTSLASGKLVSFTLRVPPEPFGGVARVVSSSSRRGTVMASFAVATMGDEERARLETLVFEAALAAVGGTGIP